MNHPQISKILNQFIEDNNWLQSQRWTTMSCKDSTQTMRTNHNGSHPHHIGSSPHSDQDTIQLLVKSHFADDCSYTLILTDLVQVWWHHCPAEQFIVEQKENMNTFGDSLKKARKFILESLRPSATLTPSDSGQLHLDEVPTNHALFYFARSAELSDSVELSFTKRFNQAIFGWRFPCKLLTPSSVAPQMAKEANFGPSEGLMLHLLQGAFIKTFVVDPMNLVLATLLCEREETQKAMSQKDAQLKEYREKAPTLQIKSKPPKFDFDTIQTKIPRHNPGPLNFQHPLVRQVLHPSVAQADSSQNDDQKTLGSQGLAQDSLLTGDLAPSLFSQPLKSLNDFGFVPQENSQSVVTSGYVRPVLHAGKKKNGLTPHTVPKAHKGAKLVGNPPRSPNKSTATGGLVGSDVKDRKNDTWLSLHSHSSTTSNSNSKLHLISHWNSNSPHTAQSGAYVSTVPKNGNTVKTEDYSRDHLTDHSLGKKPFPRPQSTTSTALPGSEGLGLSGAAAKKATATPNTFSQKDKAEMIKRELSDVDPLMLQAEQQRRSLLEKKEEEQLLKQKKRKVEKKKILFV